MTETLRTPAIDPKVGLRLSASQIDTFRLCPRKWAYSRVYPGRSAGPAAELGTEVHALLEAWTLHGKNPHDAAIASERARAIAAALIPFAPAPGTAIVEGEIWIVRSSASFSGRYDDLQEPSARVHLPIIGDWKTTSDLKWAKTEDDLRTKDVPAALYAEHAMNRYGVDEVILEWRYATTAKGKPTKTRLVRTTITRADVRETLAGVDATADEIREHMSKAIEEIPRNASGCDAFGGCPYIGECAPTAQERFRATMTQASTTPMTLREKLLAQSQGKATAPSAAAPANNPPTPAADAKPEPAAGSMAAKLAARKAAEANGSAAAAPTTPTPASSTGAPAGAAPSTTPAPATAPAGSFAARLAEREAAKRAGATTVTEPGITTTILDPSAAQGGVQEGRTGSARDPELQNPPRESPLEQAVRGAAEGQAFELIPERPTVRDHFAAAALTGLLSRGAADGLDAATRAYALADAMLAARGAP